jgi:hypothetical protein
MKSDEEAVGALSLGLIADGSSPMNRAWRQAIRDLHLRLHASKDSSDTLLKLNVVFHVPGNVFKPEFVGVRTGRYSKREAMLMVQVAVPEEEPLDPAHDVKNAVSAAIDEAARWAGKRKVPIDVSELRGILERA